MCWIDYRKAYNMVPHSWIMESLIMFKIANNVQNLLNYAMPLWKTELNSNNQNACNVVIKRGIFLGDSLLFIIGPISVTLILRNWKEAYNFSNSKERINHLLYIDDMKLYGKADIGLHSLIQTVRIFCSNICMKFGIEKCNISILKRCIKDKKCDIMLPNDLKISSLRESENYRYLGIRGWGHKHQES